MKSYLTVSNCVYETIIYIDKSTVPLFFASIHIYILISLKAKVKLDDLKYAFNDLRAHGIKKEVTAYSSLIRTMWNVIVMFAFSMYIHMRHLLHLCHFLWQMTVVTGISKWICQITVNLLLRTRTINLIDLYLLRIDCLWFLLKKYYYLNKYLPTKRM